MKQWHPVFVSLLRPVVEAYYEVRTAVPVGDVPREADIVLLRRKSRTHPPFQGLWRYLTAWKVLEFKGPSVSPRQGDLDRLVELGLGIDRRLGEQHAEPRHQRPTPEEVSFWYLANHLGRRFLHEADQRLGQFERLGPGLWRGVVLRRLVLLVSSVDLPLEHDSLPLHVVAFEPPEKERQVARLVAEQVESEAQLAAWMAALHPAAWREVEPMSKAKTRRMRLDFGPVIEVFGVDWVIERIGEKTLLDGMGVDRILANLSARKRRELKRRFLEEEQKKG